MKFKKVATVALLTFTSAATTSAATPFDEQFDAFSKLQQDSRLSSGSSLGAIFGDFGSLAAVTPSYLNREDMPASSGNTLCKTELECTGHQVSMVSNLGMCKEISETNCIQNISATNASGLKINYTNQRYFPAAQALVFKGNPDARVPDGSTSSVVQLPTILNAAGTSDYAVNAYVISRFTHNSDGSGTYSDPLFLASIHGIQIINGNYTPRIAQTNTSGLDWEPLGRNPECVVMEIGLCGRPVSLPTDTSFSLTLRLNQNFYGWLHGRLNGGSVSSIDLGQGKYVVEISGKPARIPIATGVVDKNLAPIKLLQNSFGVQSVDNLQSSGGPLIAIFAPVRGTYSYNGFLDWQPFLNPNAAAMPTVWSVRNITKDQVVASAGDKALSCLKETAMSDSKNGIAGFVNTNATSYMSGPPIYNSEDQSLTYQVAAPHYATDGSEFKGLYSLQIRADTARCIFNLTNAPVKATVSVTSTEGVEQTVATSVSLKGDFYYFQASGFHFSAPSIKLKMSNISTAPESSTSQKSSGGQSTTSTKQAKPVQTSAIKCIKGKQVKKVIGVNPRCPAGYRKA